ncbi:MAG: DNA gyrase inhibitor YacG [Pseudomonas sp.]|uniref:DNA gyrase inhibitor YacG n=1 Tax=Pseudomonas sp. TaxID=306 RepID=UPI0033971B46
MNPPLTINCPTCNAPVEWSSQNVDRPFCSERCKLIDLGAWAAEAHTIPGDPLDEDELFSGDLPPRAH